MSSLPISRPIYNADLYRPIRDPKYRAWIRTLPCAVCGTRRGIQCAHTGDHGLGQKASDRRSIPLCVRCHEDYGRVGRRQFETMHELDIEVLILRLNEKPLIRLMGARYVMILAGEEYDLGIIDRPVKEAVKRAIVIARSRILFEDARRLSTDPSGQ